MISIEHLEGLFLLRDIAIVVLSFVFLVAAMVIRWPRGKFFFVAAGFSFAVLTTTSSLLRQRWIWDQIFEASWHWQMPELTAILSRATWIILQIAGLSFPWLMVAGVVLIRKIDPKLHSKLDRVQRDPFDEGAQNSAAGLDGNSVITDQIIQARLVRRWMISIILISLVLLAITVAGASLIVMKIMA